ncbi:hypothetical protein PIROE2DRAFT_9991 [Piromyces sp. E2]|nr:hypothetical protein PIROE2DRAFT_9991 [Piromyces sp. E2]|eukprot:OUM63447.1 hypothetical protein PIROE2DRAFT_9991 [Piromyces sp. E2]
MTSQYFVDKTELIFEINKIINSSNKKNFICLSLNEKFNKSIISNMLIAYYEYSEKESIIFNDTKLSKIKIQSHENDDNNKTEEWKKYLNKFNIIELNMKEYSFGKELKWFLKNITREIKKTNKNFEFRDENELKVIFEDIYKNSNQSLIINNECLALTFMTGTLPIDYYYENSNLSYIFEDEEVRELCEKYLNNKTENNTSNIPNKRRKLNEEDKTRSIEEINNDKVNPEEELIHKKEATIIYEKIKSFYYGYRLFDTSSNKKYVIYCPNSIDKALKNNNIEKYQIEKDINFWYFKNIIQNNYTLLKDVIPLLMEMKEISINSLNYQNDTKLFNRRKKIIFRLVHLGYLGYDSDTENIFIPNKEIQKIFKEFLTPELINYLNKRNILITIFNPGENVYKKFTESRYFVDKTELILQLNDIIDKYDKLKNVCITRPRRFGKTVTVDMIKAYYSYSESKITAFEDKAIANNENWDKYLGKFNVIQLNMLNYFSMDTTLEEGINNIKNEIIECVKKVIPDFKCNYEKGIEEIVKEIYIITGRKIVFIIDEWDFIIRKKEEDMETHIKYMDFLALCIKDKPYIALTYMTGIYPIKGYKNNSSIKGIFWEFSMTSPNNTAKYVGFTDGEVKMLCEKFKNLNQESNNKEESDNLKRTNYKNIKERYNGYQLVDNKNGKKYEIYSPISIIKSFYYNYIDNFWNKTETSSLLFDNINMKFGGLKEDILYLMEDKNNELKINIEKYQNNTMEINSKHEILTHLVHLGYLAYNNEKGTVYIPNKEVHREFEIFNCDKEATK